MRHTFNIRPFLFLLLGGLFFSCEELVDTEEVLPLQRLLVSSTMVPSEPVAVKVGSRINVIEGIDDMPVDNAYVVVYVSGNIPAAELPYVEGSNGVYRDDSFLPIPDVNYEVQVIAPGFDPAVARITVPPAALLESIRSKNVTREKNGDQLTYSFDFEFSFDDPPSEVNYYNLRLYQERRQYVVHPSGDTTISDYLIEPIDIPASDNHDYKLTREPGGILFKDNPFIDQTIRLSSSIDVTKEKIGKILAELRTVSEAYYLYEESIINGSVGPVGGLTPSGGVYSNVDGGGGTVSGYSSNSDSLSLEE